MDIKLAYSIKECAAALGVAPSTVRLMVEQGQVRAVRVGAGKGKLLIPAKALEDLLAGSES